MAISVNPFATPGPWIHPCTVELGRPNPHHRPTEDRLTQIIYGDGVDGVSLAQCRSFVKAVVKHAQECFETLNNSDRDTVALYLGLHDQPTPGYSAVLDHNSSIPPAIRNGFLPLLALDAILHTGEPSYVQAPVSRQLTRPETPRSHHSHFKFTKSWLDVLKEGHETYRRSTEYPQIDWESTTASSKQECFRRLAAFNSSKYSGSQAQHNLEHVVFMLRAMAEGHCILDKDTIIDLAFKDAQRRHNTLTITREDVMKVIPNPDVAGIPAALAVALLLSPILLLQDIAYSEVYDPGISIVDVWRAGGNIHHVTFDHPLNTVNRVLWKLILSAAFGKTKPDAILDEFFKNPEVQELLENGCLPKYADALKYASDGLDTHPIRQHPDDNDQGIDVDFPTPTPAPEPTGATSGPAPGATTFDAGLLQAPTVGIELKPEPFSPYRYQLLVLHSRILAAVRFSQLHLPALTDTVSNIARDCETLCNSLPVLVSPSGPGSAEAIFALTSVGPVVDIVPPNCEFPAVPSPLSSNLFFRFSPGSFALPTSRAAHAHEFPVARYSRTGAVGSVSTQCNRHM
ncbi:hypothetical protein B0H13DRAFT_2031558 [Mycena leptocephala]|nr:hypothetical protein B0H13DRAFT_2031558 [Mycena leptocephala]